MSKPGAVFISYRRQDSQSAAGRLAQDLKDRLGADRVFRDVGGLEPGTPFPTALRDALQSCAAVAVVIGPRWETAQDASGRRRLDDAEDWVRQEIATALTREVPVVPVLVERTDMPGAESLPKELRRLAEYQACELTDRHWRKDVDALAALLARILGVRVRDPGRRRAALAAAVLLAGAGLAAAFWPPGKPPPTPLVVRLHGPAGPLDTLRVDGEVLLDAGGERLVGPLSDGEAVFREMSGDFRGRTVRVELREVAGYLLKETAPRVVPSDGVLAVELTPAASLVSGTVGDARGQPLAGAVVDLENGLAKATTDALGNFRVEVALPPGTTVPVRVVFDGRVGYSGNLTVPGSFTLRYQP
jgi:hypothetical protein